VALLERIELVLDGYLVGSKEGFGQHPLANFIRTDFRNELKAAVGDTARLLFKGSAGQGNWARGPWVGAFDQLVTTSAQSGYYIVLLFREDMQGVYLSLNQGMTEAKRLYKSDAKTALKARAANFRAMLGRQIVRFPDLSIDLAPSSTTNDTAFYEAGNICAKYYPKEDLPSEVALITDLCDMLRFRSAV
jgi:5-methylcytosine-specific restriction protein A